MDDFRHYQALRDAEATAQVIYQSGQQAGLDTIAGIRMIRSVCNLTLAEAKEVTGSSRAWSEPQAVVAGGWVSWETTEGGRLNMTRRGLVLSVGSGLARVAVLDTRDLTTGAVVASDPGPLEIQDLPLDQLERSPLERLEAILPSIQAVPAR